ncbi:hypothetical protein PMAYCL1PPCAC_01081, partial [Pristionchus mayeri]
YIFIIFFIHSLIFFGASLTALVQLPSKVRGLSFMIGVLFVELMIICTIFVTVALLRFIIFVVRNYIEDHAKIKDQAEMKDQEKHTERMKSIIFICLMIVLGCILYAALIIVLRKVLIRYRETIGG